MQRQTIFNKKKKKERERNKVGWKRYKIIKRRRVEKLIRYHALDSGI